MDLIDFVDLALLGFAINSDSFDFKTHFNKKQKINKNKLKELLSSSETNEKKVLENLDNLDKRMFEKYLEGCDK